MRELAVSVGQCSERGRKPRNQDFHGAVMPSGSVLALKGVAVALADGISSSPVGHIAAETAVKTFLTDYYCTPDAWSVRTSVTSVVTAANGWLHSETRHSHAAHDLDRGYVCTFCALVIKGRFVHTFHVGDSRISRVAGDTLEPLTIDHRAVISSTESHLVRALGMAGSVEIDHASHALSPGDIYVLSTDGVHEHLDGREIAALIRADEADLESAARQIVDAALDRGSEDNLTVQVVRIDALPDGDALDYAGQTQVLAPPPIPEPPAMLDGYRLLRQVHASDRSHVFLAVAPDGQTRVAVKIPSQTLRADPDLLRRFAMEEWIARRVDSPHVLRAHVSPHPRTCLFAATEHVEGQSLRQWMHDHPAPDVQVVRGIIEQVVRGVRALHRREMIHCDLRPENIMIDGDGTVKIIDFGAVRVTGLVEAAGEPASGHVLGSIQYTAPEWLAGEPPTWCSDLFSVAVITYEMLTGRLPYGAAAARVRTPAQQRALRYRSARAPNGAIPVWVDGALRKALHPDPARRYQAMSEFMTDLAVPNPALQAVHGAPLLERDPVKFWKGVSALLVIALVAALLTH